MKIRHETEACFANRSEAVDFATKALGNPGNNRVWYSFYPFEEEGSERRFKVTVESTVET